MGWAATSSLYVNNSLYKNYMISYDSSGCSIMITKLYWTNPSVTNLLVYRYDYYEVPTKGSISASGVGTNYVTISCSGWTNANSIVVTCSNGTSQTISGASGSCTFSGLSESTTYTFTAQAYNAISEASYSNSTSATTTSSAPTPKTIPNSAKTSSYSVGCYNGGVYTFLGNGYLDVYNSSLTRTQSATPFSAGSVSGSGCTCLNSTYSLFLGGATTSAYQYGFLINQSGTSASSSKTSINIGTATNRIALAGVGSVAVAIGGVNQSEQATRYTTSSNYRTTKTLWSSSGTRSSSTTISITGCDMGCGTTPNNSYAVFAGGQNASSAALSTVYAFNSSGTQSTWSSLSGGRHSIASAVIGSYLVFAGGLTAYSASGQSYLVDVFNNSGTKSTWSNLNTSSSGYGTSGGAITNYAIFNAGNVYTSYNASGTKSSPSGTATPDSGYAYGRNCAYGNGKAVFGYGGVYFSD